MKKIRNMPLKDKILLIIAIAAWSGSIKFAAATGVSSGITGAWSKANRFPTVPAWAPW